MEYAIRVFLLIDGKIKRIGVDRFSQIGNEAVPEYAGQKIPYSLLVFEREEGKLGDLRYHEGGYLGFDKEGKVDESSGWNHLRLAQEGKNDPKSFAARRAEQVRREDTFQANSDQLNQMIVLAKRSKSRTI